MSANQTLSRRRWLLWLPVVLVILGVVAFLVWWQYYKTTPAYALALLVDASQQNDRATFDHVVNLDRLIDNFIAQGAQDSAIGLTTSTVTSVRTQVQSLAPEKSASVKEGIRAEIQNRINEIAGPSGAKPFVVTVLAIPLVTQIHQAGDQAQVRVSRAPGVELTMERSAGGNWQVTALRDQALARRVISVIVKQLPQSESELGKQIQRQLDALPEKLPQFPLP